MKMKKKITLLFLAFFLISLISCETTESLSCPYVLAKPHVELGENENMHYFAGMYFSLFNDSDKTIDSFTISFLLYDSDGNNPFIGSNCIVSRCDCQLFPQRMENFIISLDSFISLVPEEPYITDFIYIREIRYSDGTSWKDPYGMYCVRESHE
ncbi:hypothetical protein [uncultured Treponema sp.]|uniref:hypothetical protein n=2 Tax=Treponema TaxID=157 RepID=UPI0025EAF155|nr:hypothetical protein [uncultured Treponema sp.]